VRHHRIEGEGARMVALTEEGFNSGGSCVIPAWWRASGGQLWTRAWEGAEEGHT
jgi:hypothetical protein